MVPGNTGKDVSGVDMAYYTAESLEAELRSYEERFGLSSDEFIAKYRTGGIPTTMPYVDGFVWADTYAELCRLRSVPQPQLA